MMPDLANEIKQKARRVIKDSKMVTQASLNKSLTLSKQTLNEGDESSDFSIYDSSNLLELMQKLKKLDPESLILNFSQSDDPDLESDL